MKFSMLKLTWLALVIGMLSGCGVDEETIYPVVHINSPASNTEYNVLDTIALVIRVDYPKTTVLLKVNLQNESLVPVAPTLQVDQFATGTETTLYYAISSRELESGSYKLMAEASDGSIYTRNYVTVYINGIDRVLSYVFVVEETGTNNHQIRRYDPTVQNPLTVNFSGDYAGSDVSSQAQLFFIAGAHFGDLTAYHADDLLVKWTSPITSSSTTPYFTCVQTIGSNVFAGLWEGYNARWNMSGTKGVSTELTSTTFSRLLYNSGKYLISAAVQKSNYLTQWLEVYYIDLGGMLVATVSDIQPVVFTEPTPGSVLILGNNQNGKAYTRTFNPMTGNLGFPPQPFELPAVSIHAGVAVTNTRIALAMEDGIYLYDFQAALLPISTQTNVRAIRYDNISRRLWCITANKLLVMELSGSTVAEYIIGTDLVNLHLMYNK